MFKLQRREIGRHIYKVYQLFKKTGLFLKNTLFDEMITKFVLNAILHNVSMSWIISSNKEMKYEIDENDHQDWLKKGP